MRKLTRLELAALIGSFMVAITINAVFRVRAMGAAERQRREAEAAADASTDGDVSDAGLLDHH